jgi:hypothetical protein
LLGPGEDDDLASVRLVTGFRLRGEIADVEVIAAREEAAGGSSREGPSWNCPTAQGYWRSYTGARRMGSGART